MIKDDAQLDIKSFDMAILFLPSKIPRKKPRPVSSDSDDTDADGDEAAGGGGVGGGSEEASAVVAGLGVWGGGGAAGGGGAGGGGGNSDDDVPFSCDPEGVLSRLRPLSYRCPEEAPSSRLRTLPLGLLPIPYQLPREWGALWYAAAVDVCRCVCCVVVCRVDWLWCVVGCWSDCGAEHAGVDLVFCFCRFCKKSCVRVSGGGGRWGGSKESAWWLLWPEPSKFLPGLYACFFFFFLPFLTKGLWYTGRETSGSTR